MARSAIIAVAVVATLLAGCSSVAKSTPVAKATATVPASNGTPSGIVPTYPPNLHLTPIPGDYSVYVDPTYGYSVQYPSPWLVQPAVGLNESNVTMQEPYTTDPNNPADPTHAVTLLLVRATTNYQESFVQKLLCFSQTDDTAGPYPAVNLNTFGGDPVNGYSAPALGRIFFAKGIAFEIWLQSSSRIYLDQFFAYITPIFQHILATFNPGPGAKPTATC